MGKINLKGLACLGRYQRFEDVSSSMESGVNGSPERMLSYNCSHCGHHGTINAADEEEFSQKKKNNAQSAPLNNSSSSSLGSEKFILGKNCHTSVKSVVNDLGLGNNPKKKNDNNSTLFMKKLLSFRKEQQEVEVDNKNSSSMVGLNEDWSPILEGNDPWFRPGFDRDLTHQHLVNLSSGSFIVRRSKSRRDALALSLKTPSRHLSKVAHFLILILPNGAGFRLKGSKKTFPTLRSLIVHHSVMSEILPCPLLLPSYASSSLRCGSENASESSETEEEDSREEDIADISNYPDLLLTLRQTLYAATTQDV